MNSKHFVFMSIFYPQEKWHLLLSAIPDILKRVEIRRHSEKVLVFLNHHRGANLRFVIEFNSKEKKAILKKISKSIQHFKSRWEVEIFFRDVK